jgi:hypothetical protein
LCCKNILGIKPLVGRPNGGAPDLLQPFNALIPNPSPLEEKGASDIRFQLNPLNPLNLFHTLFSHPVMLIRARLAFVTSCSISSLLKNTAVCAWGNMV